MCSVIELQKPARPATGGVPAGTPLLFHVNSMNSKIFSVKFEFVPGNHYFTKERIFIAITSQ